MVKKVLVTDIATNTGFAVDSPSGGQKPICGSFLIKHEVPHLGQAYVQFENHLEDLFIVHKPDVFAFEAPLPRGRKDGVGGAPTSANAVRKLLGLAAIAELVATRHHCEVFEANIQSVRSHFVKGVGRGKNQKAAVFRMCWTLGWKPADEDASDACALWSYTHAIVNKFTPIFGSMPLFKEGLARR